MWYTSMMDGSFWEKPHEFNPDRHLDKKVDSPFIFGTGAITIAHKQHRQSFRRSSCLGRRSCLGEALARVESFLVFANLLHSFSLSACSALPGEGEIVDGLAVSPKEFRLKVEERKLGPSQ